MATYKQALYWIAENDDTSWLDRYDEPISITAALVADLFNKPDSTVRVDLMRTVKTLEQRQRRAELTGIVP